MLKYFLTVIFLMLFCLPAFAGDEKPEPEYEGKTLSEWIKQLQDKDEGKREIAAYALGAIKDKSAVPALINAACDKDGNFSMGCVSALGQIADQAAIPILIKALYSDEYHVVREAAYGLGHIGKPAIPAVLKELNQKDIPSGAVMALREIADKSTTHILIKLLENIKNRVAVRYIAAEALGNIGDKSAIPSLIKGLDDEEEHVRNFCVMALGRFKDKAVIPPLIKALDSKEDPIRWNAALGLRDIGDKSAVPALVKALKGGNSGAALALGSIGDKTVIPVLVQALGNDNESVRRHSAEALEKLTGQNFGNDQAKWCSWWEATKDQTFKEKAPTIKPNDILHTTVFFENIINEDTYEDICVSDKYLITIWRGDKVVVQSLENGKVVRTFNLERVSSLNKYCSFYFFRQKLPVVSIKDNILAVYGAYYDADNNDNTIEAIKLINIENPEQYKFLKIKNIKDYNLNSMWFNDNGALLLYYEARFGDKLEIKIQIYNIDDLIAFREINIDSKDARGFSDGKYVVALYDKNGKKKNVLSLLPCEIKDNIKEIEIYSVALPNTNAYLFIKGERLLVFVKTKDDKQYAQIIDILSGATVLSVNEDEAIFWCSSSDEKYIILLYKKNIELSVCEFSTGKEISRHKLKLKNIDSDFKWESLYLRFVPLSAKYVYLPQLKKGKTDYDKGKYYYERLSNNVYIVDALTGKLVRTIKCEKPKNDYYIQFGAYCIKRNAENKAKELSGIKVVNDKKVRIKIELINHKTFYLVQVGPFKTEREALSTAKKMSTEKHIIKKY